MDNKELLSNILNTGGGGGSRDTPHTDAPLDASDPLIGVDEVSVSALQRMKQRAGQFQQKMKGPIPTSQQQIPYNPPVNHSNQRIQELLGQIEFLKLRLECAERHLQDNNIFQNYKSEWIEIMLEAAGDNIMAAAGMGLLKKKNEQEKKQETTNE